MSANNLSYANAAEFGVESKADLIPRLRFPLGVIGFTTIAFCLLLFFGPPTLGRLFGIFLLPIVAGGVVGIWWMTRREVAWRTRWLVMAAVAVCAVAGVALAEKLTWKFVLLWGVPATFAVVILVTALLRSAGARASRLLLFVVGGLALIPWLLVRTNGQQGEGMISFAGRWSKTHDQKVAEWANRGAATTRSIAVVDLAVAPGDWPAFRGAGRDSVTRGLEIRAAEFAGHPFQPVARWRHPVGLGWSSFAVVGNHAFTQEQRERLECVVCYDIRDGRQVWIHSDENRFEEMSGGPGPRATPTFAEGRVFTLGPTGLLNCLDAATGAVAWREAAHAKASNPPQWGFAASPLVVDEKVIVAPAGAGGVKLAAYDVHNGHPIWSAAGGKAGYSSPTIGTLGGVKQVVVLDGEGVSGHSLDDGKRLWFLAWDTREPKTATPCIVDDSTVLVGMGYGRGLRLVSITHSGESWAATEKWHTTKLNPKFNDLIVSGGNIYGFDEGVLTCVSLADGSRRWRGTRYGYGQILLVGSKLIVLAESGEVAVVAASPDKFVEFGRFSAIEGKTWAHPVLVGGSLLVRNGEEAACYDLSPWITKRDADRAAHD